MSTEKTFADDSIADMPASIVGDAVNAMYQMIKMIIKRNMKKGNMQNPKIFVQNRHI